MKHISTGRLALLMGLGAMSLGFTSCNDEPDKYEHTGGKPSIEYIRSTDPNAADSLLTGAFLGNTVAIVGENLTAIHKLYFNDQQAVLNTSLITSRSLLVDLPSQIPAKVTDCLYMETWDGETIAYPFKSLVPAPKASNMSCEWANAGTTATIYGDYFVNDPSFEMTVADAAGHTAEITSMTQTQVTFEVPETWEPGYVYITSIYGKGKSKFRYKDDMNILFDWDGTHGGHDLAHGWRNGVVHNPGDDEAIVAVDGPYLYFGGADIAGDVGASWAEDNFSFNYWPEPGAGYEKLSARPEFASIIAKEGIQGMQMKMEVLVPASNPWMSSSLQIIFTPYDVVNYGAASNAFISDATLPRGLWTPWQTTGSYDTAGQWVTVTLPLSTFSMAFDGTSAGSPIDQSCLDGLTMFVWNGGVPGTDCSPVICIDNIRVVPIE